MYIGYQSFVRGYDGSTFSSGRIAPAGSPDYFDFNRLLGSKMLVSNLEVRFPLLGLFGLGSSYYGALPIETAAFFDAGVIWDNRNKAWFLGGDRKPLRSYGFALRMNVFGFAMIELDYSRPIDRPDSGWVWQFGFTPGL